MSKVTKKDLNERLLMVETLLGLHRTLPEQISNEQANNAIFRMQCALSSGKELAERNPTEVEQRIEALEEFATYADNMLTELNHALPDPEYDAKCEAQEADVDASLDGHRERLGLNKPQLKQLDQSIFDGLDEKWRFAAVDSDGVANYYDGIPEIRKDHFIYLDAPNGAGQSYRLSGTYDTTDWQNSLIERDIAKELLEVDLSSELTGSDLAVKYFESNERHICFVGEDNDGCLSDLMIAMVVGYNEYRGFMTSYNDWFPFVTLINNQGEPLTASEVGL